MQKKIKIKALPDDIKDERDNYFTEKSIFVPPFLMIISGSVCGGKTTTLLNIMLNKEFEIQQFFLTGGNENNVFIFSKTAKIDPAYKLLLKLIPEQNVIDELNENIINRIMKNQFEKLKKDPSISKKKSSHYLFLIDDMAGEKIMIYNNLLVKLAYIYRHLKISHIYLVQKLTTLGRGIRANAKYLITFGFRDGQEIESFSNSQRSVLDMKTFKKIYSLILNGPKYSFLFIDTTKPLFQSYRFNFDYIIDIKIKNYKCCIITLIIILVIIISTIYLFFIFS